MLRYRSARHNKRIRDSDLLTKYPQFAELRMLKSVRSSTGNRYVLYDPVDDAYFIAFVSLDGQGSLLAKHEGRIDNLNLLLTNKT